MVIVRAVIHRYEGCSWAKPNIISENNSISPIYMTSHAQTWKTPPSYDIFRRNNLGTPVYRPWDMTVEANYFLYKEPF
jgi:hypothetical protein